MYKKYVLAVFAALILALNACGKKEEPRKAEPIPPASAPAPAGVMVVTITLGNAIGGDKKVTRVGDSFGKNDTIYASVDTTGAGIATLKAKWIYRKGGQEAIVKEETQTIMPTAPASSEFHVSKPDGWPIGDYQVEILVGDKSAGTKTFTVK